MPLQDRITKCDELKVWYGLLPVQYLYTAGIVADKFFKELKENAHFYATKCNNCNYVYLPPKSYCEKCATDISDNWQKINNKGEVYSYTYNDNIILALIRLESTTTLLLHKLDEVDKENIKIGVQVEALFKGKEQRTGSILDIAYFKPA